MDLEQFWTQKGQVTVVIGTGFVVSTLRQGIRLAHALPWSMVEGEIKARQVQGPSCLSPVELLSHAKVLQVLVVSEDLDGMLGAFKVVSPLLKGPDDGKHLCVMDLVVPFNLVKALGQERDWMPFVILT
jgi:hypothetical protein